MLFDDKFASDKNHRAWYLKAKVKVPYTDRYSYQIDYEAVEKYIRFY